MSGIRAFSLLWQKCQAVEVWRHQCGARPWKCGDTSVVPGRGSVETPVWCQAVEVWRHQCRVFPGLLEHSWPLGAQLPFWSTAGLLEHQLASWSTAGLLEHS
ncbi:hypothetical protein ACOMHN_066289 [Nucella lapillus]